MSRNPSRKLPISVWDVAPSVLAGAAMVIACVAFGLEFWRAAVLFGPTAAALLITDGRLVTSQQQVWGLRDENAELRERLDEINQRAIEERWAD